MSGEETTRGKGTTMTSTLRPCKLQGDCITIQEIAAEVLIYDERTHRAWCLNPSSACIWRLCDGRKTVGAIAASAAQELGAGVDEGLVLVTLAELHEKGLLEEGMAEGLPLDASRREMLGRIGWAAAALLPVVAAIGAPPAWAQSGSTGTDFRKRQGQQKLTQQQQQQQGAEPPQQ
jgi:Coenzyme PQQ synthesis protein D (PqqD)